MRGMDRKEMTMPTHKVGIKLLTDSQMMNVFPSYQNLLERIENHRKQISKLSGEKLRHYQYNMMYDNVFSILGHRGTGKTSVAFTLQEKFRESKEHPYDVVLPIIIPEVIPSDCSALGWLLEIVREEITDLVGNDEEQDTSDFWDKCKCFRQSEEKRALKNEFEELERLYYSMKYNPSTETSYFLAVGNSTQQAQNYYKFARKITEFWSDLVKLIRKEYSNQSDRNLETDAVPLIYFIFDDVDLAPEKVYELLSIIIKYLSHPNVIVLTTADEEMVLEVIENNLDKNIGRLPKEWRNYLNKKRIEMNSFLENENIDTKRADLISKTARLYLGKVMPTSTRYYLKLFETAEEKGWFRIDDERQLGTEVSSIVDKMLKRVGSKNRNFYEIENIQLNFYLNFFGNTSRQIGNAFLGMQEFIEEITKVAIKQDKKEEEDVENIFELCIHFLHVAITANHGLAEIVENIEEFVHGIFWLERNSWKLYIDYAYLQEILQNLLLKEKKETVMKATLQLYSLMLFVENILVIVDSAATNVVAGRKYVHGIPGMIRFICEQAFGGRQKFRTDLRAEEFFLHYNALLNRIPYVVKNESKNEQFDREYLYDFLDYQYKENEVAELELLKFFEKSRDWLHEMITILSMVYGNFYLLGKTEIEACLLYKKENGLCKYQQDIEAILLIDLRENLKYWDLKEKAKESLEEALKSLHLEIGDGKIKDYSEQIKAEIRTDIYIDIQRRLSREEAEKEGFLWERVKEVYANENVIPLSRIIHKIDDQCEGETFRELLEKIPQTVAIGIVEKIDYLESKENILLVLNIVQDLIVKWDYQSHFITFGNMSQFLRILETIDDADDAYIEIRNVAERISDMFSESNITHERIRSERNWSFLDTSIYADLKTALRNAHMLLENEEYVEREYPGYYWSGGNKKLVKLENVEKNFDVAISLEDQQGFEDAVAFGVMVQILKRLQRLYLYQTIVQKYDMGYASSSERLEKMTLGRGKRRTRRNINTESYYYKIFLTMKELLEKDDSKLTDEMKVLKNFVGRASSESRNQYLTNLIDEVKNE